MYQLSTVKTKPSVCSTSLHFSKLITVIQSFFRVTTVLQWFQWNFRGRWPGTSALRMLLRLTAVKSAVNGPVSGPVNTLTGFRTTRPRSPQSPHSNLHGFLTYQGLWVPGDLTRNKEFFYKMAGVGASKNDDKSAPNEHSPDDLEIQKKEITEGIKKPLRKGDTW